MRSQPILCLFLVLVACNTGAQVTSAFTYQGELEQAGVPATGEYDFEFVLYDTQSAGMPFAGPDVIENVLVDGGLFSAEIDFGANVFGRTDLWLEVRVREGGSIGPFTPLLPRQPITPAPVAQYALDFDAGAAGGAFWSTSGNAAASGDFLGTTNTTPLVLRVDDQSVLRIFDREHFGHHAPNLIAGSEFNALDESGGSVEGATIGGGGGEPGLIICGPGGGSPCRNTVAADFATVVGGYGNYATGFGSTAMGYRTTASGSRSTAMGFHTTASGSRSTAMGYRTTASGSDSTAMGYSRTTASGDRSMAMGTQAKAEHRGAFVWADSELNDFASTGPDQFLIRAAGGVGIGTNAPVSQLHAETEVSAPSGSSLASEHVVLIENNATSGGHVLALKTSATTPGAGENFITFKSVGSDIGAIEGNGSGGVVYKTTGADFAELLPRLDPSEAIAPGAIVGVFGGLITQQTIGADRLMVVTDRPAVLGNAAEGAEATSNAVAFIGRVPVRVRGPVQVGDWIVASGRGDGIGRAVAPEAWDPARDGPIVGEAWASRAGGTGRVMTAIGLHLRRPLVERLEAQQFTIEDQNRALAEQQKQIDALRGELRSLRDLVRRAD